MTSFQILDDVSAKGLQRRNVIFFYFGLTKDFLLVRLSFQASGESKGGQRSLDSNTFSLASKTPIFTNHQTASLR